MALDLRRAITREAFFSVIAILSILIGISRIADPAPAPVWMQALDVFIAASFMTDWLLRIRAADAPWRYAGRHAYEVVFFIPFTLLPFLEGGNILRGARILRLVRVLRYGRYVRLGVSFARLPRRMRQIQRIVRHAQLVTLALAGIIAVAVGAAALMFAEARGQGIGAFSQAVWWSLSLFSTVAYAVPEPQTSAGHVISGIIMVSGVAYFGIFTASLASAILRSHAEESHVPSNAAQ